LKKLVCLLVCNLVLRKMSACGASKLDKAMAVKEYAEKAIAYVDDYGDMAQSYYDSLGGNQKKTMQWVKDQGGKDAVVGKYCVFTGPSAIVAMGTYNGTIQDVDKEKGVLVHFDDGDKKWKHAVCFVREAAEDERKEEPKANVESLWNNLAGNAKKTAIWVNNEGGIEKIKGKKAKWKGSSGFGSYEGKITGYDEKKAEIQVTWDDGSVSVKYVSTFREWVN